MITSVARQSARRSVTRTVIALMEQLGAITVPGAAGDPGKIRSSRKQVAEWASKVVSDLDRLHDIELLASEAITNGALHGTGVVAIHVSHCPERQRVRVEVLDQGPRQPDSNLRSDHGRGFTILERLAASWDLNFEPGKTTCWFEVATR